VNAVRGADFGCRKVRDDVDSVKEMAREFFKIFDLANPIHLIDNSIQNGFDFFEGFLREEGPLIFQPVFVPEKLLPIEF
jgi:hypothetical protein